jgi:hypothetical protein
MAERIDSAVAAVQSACLNPVLDCARRIPERVQLPAGNVPMLPKRQIGRLTIAWSIE